MEPSTRDLNENHTPNCSGPSREGGRRGSQWIWSWCTQTLSMGRRRMYLSNTFWLLCERSLRLVVGLAVGIQVARYLGPDGYGKLSFAGSLVGLFLPFATLGLPGIVVRELVRNPSRRGDVLGSTAGLTLAGSVVTIGLVGVATVLSGVSPTESALVLVISLGLLTHSARAIDFHFQARVESRFVVQAQLAQLLVSSLGRLLLIVLKSDLIWFAVIGLADSIVFALGLVFNYHRTRSRLDSPDRWRFRSKTARQLIENSWPLVLSGVVVTIYMRIDQVMIRAVLGSEAVGQYAAAVRISEAWLFVPGLVVQSVFPALVAAGSRSREDLELRIQTMYNLLVWFALGLSLVISLSAGAIVRILYGGDFEGASGVLAIHIWAGVFVVAAVLRGRWFIAMDLQRYSLLTVIVGASINVGGNLVLIPTMGIDGAAWATLIARFASLYGVALVFVKVRPSIASFHRALAWPVDLLAKRSNLWRP